MTGKSQYILLFTGDPSQNIAKLQDQMELDEKLKKFSTRTKRDEHGTYPAWMSKRKIQQIKSKPKNKTRNIDGTTGRICKKRHRSKAKRK